MFDGLEIDMLSLGDADCIIVTQWTAHLGPQRVLIDGGTGSDYPIIKEFLAERRMNDFWATVCTHLHGDHAGGLIKLVSDRSITTRTAWMHDIRKHLSAETLRRVSSGNSSQAEGVKEVWENTKALAKAFVGRGLTPHEPFAGAKIADWPAMTVLGPSLAFYQKAIGEFAKVEDLKPWSSDLGAFLAGAGPLRSSILSGYVYDAGLRALSGAPAPLTPLGTLMTGFEGVLRNSAVEEKPTTQPFNNTSTILGVVFNGRKFLFAGDAGSDSLDAIPPEWSKLDWMQVPHHGSDGNLSKPNIERFCPKTAYVSAVGKDNHPDSAIVNGLIKVGATVFSTHSLKPGHLWYWCGAVPARPDYGAAVPLKGTADPVAPNFDMLAALLAARSRS